MGGLRKYRRNIARTEANKQRLKPNKKYINKTKKEKAKSGLSIVFEKLFEKRGEK